ncbi:hypothetical protein EVAR_70926_1 [Eumeta japonica]|uniref:MADF domain-containing protein n=1 Tax=Eumeta variegata TaxID=151549 RepID=A0A4C1T6X7_EUMVA|nr:hypothetical protein EVAR_70926_1 [Eumeta japonica]
MIKRSSRHIFKSAHEARIRAFVAIQTRVYALHALYKERSKGREVRSRHHCTARASVAIIVYCVLRVYWFKMEPFDNDRIITEINSRPTTWNSLLSEYSNKVLNRNAWDELCQIFYNNFNEITNKEKTWQSLNFKKSGRVLRTLIKETKRRTITPVNNNASGSGAKPRRPYIYSNLLTFLDPLYQIRSPSQNDDAALEHDQDYDFQKPHSPKKSKKTTKHEDPQDKLFEALTTNLKQSKEANNTILSENPDTLFLVSLAKDFSAIKEEFKLEAKADMINLIRKYRNMGQSSRTLHENRYQGYKVAIECRLNCVYARNLRVVSAFKKRGVLWALALTLSQTHIQRRSTMQTISYPLQQIIKRFSETEPGPSSTEKPDGICALCPRRKNRKTKKTSVTCKKFLCTEHTITICAVCKASSYDED